jgi:hypothetical protein
LPLSIGWQLHSPSSCSLSDPAQSIVALASSPPKQQRRPANSSRSPYAPEAATTSRLP